MVHEVEQFPSSIWDRQSELVRVVRVPEVVVGVEEVVLPEVPQPVLYPVALPGVLVKQKTRPLQK